MNLLQQLEKAIKDRIKLLKPNELKIAELVLKIIAGVLCLAIFVCGYWFGSINLDSTSKSSGIVDVIEKSKLIFPLIAAVLAWLFVTLLETYVEGYEEKYQDEKVGYEKKYQNEKNEIEKCHHSEILKLKQDMDKDSSYRKEQELEFLSIFNPEKNLDNLNFTAFCKPVRKLHSTSQLIKELSNYNKELKGRDEALEGLSKGFTREHGEIPFFGLIGQACSHALNIHISELDESAKPFCLDMAAYLKAWLVCSIKHGVPIRIKPFYRESLGDWGTRYQGKETYIKAIKYIKKEGLESKELQRFFPTQDSIIIVDKYLEGLIDILELE